MNPVLPMYILFHYGEQGCTVTSKNGSFCETDGFPVLGLTPAVSSDKIGYFSVK